MCLRFYIVYLKTTNSYLLLLCLQSEVD